MSYSVPKITSERHYIRNAFIVLASVAALKFGYDIVGNATDFKDFEINMPQGDYSQQLNKVDPQNAALTTQALLQGSV